MKKPLSPALIAAILGIVVVALGLFFWKQNGGPGGDSGGGRMKSDLGPMEQDPEKFKKGMEELISQSKHDK